MRRIIAGMLLLAALTGCGSAKVSATFDPCAPGAVTGVLNLTMLRQQAYDYQPYESVEAMAREVEGDVVTGEVVEFVPGKVVEEMGTRDHHVLMRVRVSERFKGKPAEYVDAELFQGGVTGSGQPVYSVADFAAAVPAGTRVMLFMNESVPFPQGLILEQVTKSGRTLLGGLDDLKEAWNDPCGIEGLAARLRK